MYDAKTGRFLSEDPLGYAAGDANLYRYVFNSPVNYVDPTGQTAVLARAPIAPPPPAPPAPAPVPPPTIPPPGPPPGGGLAELIKFGAAGALAWLWVLLGAKPVNVGEDEFLDPNICSEIEVPWRERNNWPRNCQFSYKIPGPPGENYDICAYICRDWGLQSTINKEIPRGSKCPTWFNWIPERIDPDNLPPDAIP